MPIRPCKHPYHRNCKVIYSYKIKCQRCGADVINYRCSTGHALIHPDQPGGKCPGPSIPEPIPFDCPEEFIRELRYEILELQHEIHPDR